MISRPAVISSPIRQGPKRGRPERGCAQLDRILLCGQDEIRPRAGDPTLERADVMRSIGMMVRKHAEVDQLACRGSTECDEIPRVADSAKSHDGFPFELDERRRLALESTRSSGACRASTHFSGPACRSASARIAARSRSATRSDRDMTTTPARLSDRTGSRSRPLGQSCESPNGSSASSKTTSRSRASRRC